MLSGLSGYIKNVKNNVKSAMQSGPQTGPKPTLGRIRMGRREIEEIKLISQGGYAYVFKVKDSQSGEIFALKKMICQSPERLATAKNEINIMRMLPEHPNLLRVYETLIEQREGCYYAYVLLEFCEGGSIFDLMEKYESTRLKEQQIVFVLREVCEGVKVLHSMRPVIAHRDLKIENVLLSNKKFKLCDFGSCSSNFVDFAKVPQSQYSTYEEEYDKNTTLMYRPPEMCDPYQRQIVCEKVDVWMIGCILYTMCFYKHPFQEMSKLSIVNAAYTFPKEHPYPEKLIDLIRIMLTPHPRERPSIFQISEMFNNYFSITSVQLNSDAQRIKEEQRKQDQDMRKFEDTSSKFKGDIPIEELMKLQHKLNIDGGESPVATNQHRSQMASQYNNPNAFRDAEDDEYGSYGNFGKTNSAKKKQQQQQRNQPRQDVSQFVSAPAQTQSTDWHNFGSPVKSQGSRTTTQQQQPQDPFNQFSSGNQGFNSFGASNNSGNRPQQGFQPQQGNQMWGNNQTPNTNQKVNEQWQNFSFGGAPSNPAPTQANNSWATGSWNQPSQPGPSNNAPQASSGQASNNWNQFGFSSNTNNQQPNMSNQQQGGTVQLTDDLLDLADSTPAPAPAKKDASSAIMSLYSMKA